MWSYPERIVATFFRGQKFVQHMIGIIEDLFKKIIIGLLSECNVKGKKIEVGQD